MGFLACRMLSLPHIALIRSHESLRIRHCSVRGIPFSQKTSDFRCLKSQNTALCIANDERGMAIEGIEEGKVRYRWVRSFPDISEYQKVAISELPYGMSNRCKAVMEQIICYEPENGSLSDLLAFWGRSMNPRRADWLLVLKELRQLEHPLYLKLAELCLEEESFEACERDYTKIMHCYAKENKLQEAENVFFAMKRKGFICDQVTLTALIHLYSKAGKLNLAEEAFEEMRLLGVPLDRRSYGAMIMAYIRAGLLTQGESLLKEMEAEENYAGREIYKALLRSYSMKGDSEGAQRIFDTIQVVGIIPDSKMCALLINAYAVADQGAEACMVFENLRKSGLQPNDKCISLVLSILEKDNNLTKALNLLIDLERDGVVLGKEGSEVLAKWFLRLGVVEEIELVLKEHALITAQLATRLIHQ